MSIKKTLMSVICFLLCSCTSDTKIHSNLSVSFTSPEIWKGQSFPVSQVCHTEGGIAGTPPLTVRNVPVGTNVFILEINNLSNPSLASNGGMGSIGFYHDGSSTAVLLPVQGETAQMPKYAFKEKSNRVSVAKPFAYIPPCLENDYLYSATVKAVKRTGSFDKQVSEILAVGEIQLGRY